MDRSGWVWALIAFAALGAVTAEGASRRRLTITNQCTDDVWAVLTPGGNPSQIAALKNSGGWFRRYATQEHFIALGVTGSIAADSATLTLAKAPGDNFSRRDRSSRSPAPEARGPTSSPRSPKCRTKAWC